MTRGFSAAPAESRPRFSLSELAERFGLDLHGDGNHRVDGVATLSAATPADITFLSNRVYRKQLPETSAGAVILAAEDAGACPVNCLVSANPYVSYARVADVFAVRRSGSAGIHPSAAIDDSAGIGEGVDIGANAVIGADSVVGDGCKIGAGSVIGEACRIGAQTQIHANATLCDGVRLGRRVIVHPGAVIGADGFGLAFDQDHWIKVPQLGSVVIGDDCEIGANSTIDRGAIEDTVLEEDVRIDNLVQIGHNVHIGAHSALAGCVGISGSTRIGKYCMMAGRTGASGHLEIADRTTVLAAGVVLKSILEPGTTVSSTIPVQPAKQWHRTLANIRRLDSIKSRLLALEKHIRKTNNNE